MTDLIITKDTILNYPKSINHPGNIIIDTNLENKIITSSKNIIIKKKCISSFLTSMNGSITILSDCINSDIDAFDEIYINNKNSLVKNSILECNFKINVFNIINSKLEITNEAKNVLPKKILFLNNQIKKFSSNLKKNKRVLEVVKILGDKINNLPLEKKEQLLNQVSILKKLQSQLLFQTNNLKFYNNLYNKNIDDKIFQIFILGKIEPETEITFGNYKKKIKPNSKKYFFCFI